MFQIANKYLLAHPVFANYIIAGENDVQTLLPCVYICEVSPLRKYYTHKYGVTTQIWNRLHGLRKDKKVSAIVRLFVFFDEKSAYDFENYIRAHVWEHGYRRGRNYNNESVRIHPGDFAKFLSAVTEKYLDYEESHVELLSACRRFIIRANKLLVSYPLRKTKHKLIVQQDLITQSNLIAEKNGPAYS
jgi:hypothetical protein